MRVVADSPDALDALAAVLTTPVSERECRLRTPSGVGSTPLSGVGRVRWHRPEAGVSLPDRSAPEDVDSEAERTRFEAARDVV